MAKDPEGRKIDYVDLFDADGAPTTDPSKAATGRARVTGPDGQQTYVTLRSPRYDPNREPGTIKGEA